MCNTNDVDMFQTLFNQALQHTGVILTRSWTLNDKWECGAASAVYVKHKDHHFAVTCRHVEAKSDIWFVNSPAIEATIEGLQSISTSSPSWPLFVWTAADIACFQADPEHVIKNKRRFIDLDAVEYIKRDELKVGWSAIITGIWAEGSKYEQHDDKLLFDPFPYSAKGVVLEVNNHEIVARFEEHKVLVWDENERHLAEMIDPKGQSRNLKGMSGSGLWIPLQNNTLIFAGILKGPKTDIGDPNIVFTPAWLIAKRLGVLFPQANPKET